MNKAYAGFASIMLLSTACTNSSMMASAQLVEVEGTMFFARPLAAANSWQAGPDEGWEVKPFTQRPDLYAINVQVIEQVSGCSVMKGSTSNQNGYTVAAVSCERV